MTGSRSRALERVAEIEAYGSVSATSFAQAGVPGEKDTDEGAIDVTEGGTALPYWLEDPFLRKEYEETLAKDGLKSKMEPELYEPLGSLWDVMGANRKGLAVLRLVAHHPNTLGTTLAKLEAAPQAQKAAAQNNVAPR